MEWLPKDSWSRNPLMFLNQKVLFLKALLITKSANKGNIIGYVTDTKKAMWTYTNLNINKKHY